jgi:DNA-binding NarL/FixJ family response regulator
MGTLRLGFNAWRELDVPFEAARTRLLMARAHTALGDADGAAREEAAAQACFDRLGVRPPREAAVAGLTPREVEVIRLLASGRSNREIADLLFVSPKTVARHLSNIFTKTGTSSRAAATAFAYDHGLMGRTTHV